MQCPAVLGTYLLLAAVNCDNLISGTCPALRSDSVDFDCRYNGEIVSCESAIIPGTTATLGCTDWYDTPLAYRLGFRKLICLREGVWDRTISNHVPVCGTVSSRGTNTVLEMASFLGTLAFIDRLETMSKYTVGI